MFHFIDDHSVHRLQSTSSVLLLLLRVSCKSKQWKQKNKKYFNFSFSYRAVYAYCTKLGKCNLRKFTYNSLTYVYNNYNVRWNCLCVQEQCSYSILNVLSVQKLTFSYNLKENLGKMVLPSFFAWFGPTIIPLNL